MKMKIKNISGEVIYSSQKRTVKDAVAEAVREGANLHGSNLTRTDLTDANLRWANLHGANLRWADLTGADLTGAYLAGAYLAGAKLATAITDDTFVQITCIGSRKDATTFCVEKTHAENPQYLREYRGAIEYFKSFRQ